MTRFSRVDGWGAGLKGLRLTRELSLKCETRLYFGNGELMERETVVVGEQGKGEICGGRATSSQKTTWLPSDSSTAIATLTLFHHSTTDSNNVETTPVQARPSRYAPTSSLFVQFLTLEL